jgi:hypothetical protein
MGLIRALIAALFLRGGAERLMQEGGRLAAVLRPDATRALQLGADAYAAAHSSHMAEFAHARQGRFDAFVNGLNRLPRPLLALGTLALFVYAMADPEGFALRMRGLAEVPEPMWWLLGAVVAFYFGAREAHHLREHRAIAPAPRTSAVPAEPTDPAQGGALGPNPVLATMRPRGADPMADPMADPQGRERD